MPEKKYCSMYFYLIQYFLLQLTKVIRLTHRFLYAILARVN